LYYDIISLTVAIEVQNAEYEATYKENIMKKPISLIIIIFLILLLLSSCNNKNENEIKINFTAEANDFLYEIEGTVLFAVDDNGDLYSVNITETDKTVIVFNLNGEKINKAVLDVNVVDCVAVKDGVFYFANSPYNTPENTEIYSYNFNTGEQRKIVGIEGFYDVKKIVPLEDKLYILGIDRELSRDASFIQGHTYGGESVISVDIKSGKYEAAAVDMPVMIAATDDNNIMIYAYSESGDYYFSRFNSDKKAINNNLIAPDSMESIFFPNFEMYGTSEIIHPIGQFLKLSPLDGSRGSRVIINDLPLSSYNNFASKSGYLFYRTQNGIRRVLVSELFKGSVTLNIAFTNPYNPNMPPPDIEKLGFDINSTFVDYYDFSLSLLSLDSQYDMYYLFSHHDISDNIRRKGAFYPLNDVPFVREYIDAIFPYVRDAAIDDNGDIWMIPLALSTTGFFYNEKLCEEYGIDITQIKAFEDVVELTSYIRNREVNAAYNTGHPRSIFDNFFYQLMRKHNGFNRDDFSRMAEYFYGNVNYIKNEWTFQEFYSGSLIDIPGGTRLNFRGRFLFNGWNVGTYLRKEFKEALGNEDYDDEYLMQLIEDIGFRTTWFNYVHNRFMKSPPIAGIENMDENYVIAEFIAVNPNSKNLDAVLEYISALCEFQLGLKNSFILKDRLTYSDRFFINDTYDIISCERNYIIFSLDEELIYSDFELFLGDEITFDEYLTRIEFKINAYLNE
jgi:hypothetical protein